MQKFKGHYKQAVSLKKSGCMDNDIMLNPYVIWKEDEGSDFARLTKLTKFWDQSQNIFDIFHFLSNYH